MENEKTVDVENSDINTEASTEKAEYNTEEANRIANERAERASKAAMKSYLKQQGLSEEEAQQAFENFKANKAKEAEAQKNDLTALQQRVSEYESNESQALKLANTRLIRADAMAQAIGIGFKADRIDYAIRLADLSQINIDENGNPDLDAIKIALKKVADDIPELLNSHEEEQQGFQMGSPGTQNKNIDERLSKIFGNK